MKRTSHIICAIAALITGPTLAQEPSTCGLMAMNAGVMTRASTRCPNPDLFDRAAAYLNKMAGIGCEGQNQEAVNYAALIGGNKLDKEIAATGLDNACNALRMPAEHAGRSEAALFLLKEAWLNPPRRQSR